MKYRIQCTVTVTVASPSMRREWIEIHVLHLLHIQYVSPSMRREWIEMSGDALSRLPVAQVSLHAEGVD